VALALYRKYRPATFAEVVGQEHVTEPLRTALASGRINHAYLFSGPRGCGKTSSARILARSLNCENGPTPDPCGECASCVALAPEGPGSLDVVELDAASHGGVGDTRELRDRAFYMPAESRYRVVIIDEAHMVTKEGFNALLKIVEEPPEHLVFVFATTEPDKVLATIRSRTHHYPFRLLPPATLRGLLEKLCGEEGVAIEPTVFPLVVRAGAGSARDALSVMDQLLAGVGADGVRYADAVALLGVTDGALLDEMVDALAAMDGAGVYGAIERVADAGHDPRRFGADLLARLRDLIMVQAVPDAAAKGLIDAPDDQLAAMTGQAERLPTATLTRFAEIVHTGLSDMRGTTSPRLVLELTAARMLLPAATLGDGGLLQRLERVERRLDIAAGGPHAEVGARRGAGPGAGEGAGGTAGARAGQGAGGGAGHGAGGRAGAGGGARTCAEPSAPRVSDGAPARVSDKGSARTDAGPPHDPAAGPLRDGHLPAEGEGGPSPATGGAAGLGDEAGPAPAVAAPTEAAPTAAGDDLGLPAPPVLSGAPPGHTESAPDEEPFSAPGGTDKSEQAASRDTDIEATDVRRLWGEIMAAVKAHSRSTQALFQSASATVVRVEGGVLYLTTPHAALARMISDTNNVDVLRRALQEVLGVRWRVRCDTGDPDGSGTYPLDSNGASGPSQGAATGLEGGGRGSADEPRPAGRAGPADEPSPAAGAQRRGDVLPAPTDPGQRTAQASSATRERQGHHAPRAGEDRPGSGTGRAADASGRPADGGGGRPADTGGSAGDGATYGGTDRAAAEGGEGRDDAAPHPATTFGAGGAEATAYDDLDPDDRARPGRPAVQDPAQVAMDLLASKLGAHPVDDGS
jgi:DNA polymerase-3 subunit gamma/tau